MVTAQIVSGTFDLRSHDSAHLIGDSPNLLNEGSGDRVVTCACRRVWGTRS